MTSATPDTNALLGRLGVVYGQPDSNDPQAFIAAYARCMRQYTDSELEEGASRILTTRKYKTWPTIAECVAALDAVRAGIRTRMAAAEAQARRDQAAQPVELTAAEQAEAERFVDAWATGKRSLLVPDDAPAGHKIEMGLLSKRLRQMARDMRERRRARV